MSFSNTRKISKSILKEKSVLSLFFFILGGSGGGAQGFMNLIGGGSEGSNKIFDILLGLAKSFFVMKMGKNKSLQDWGSAGTGQNDENTGKWADNLIGDLVFPDKKPKDIVQDDDDPKGKDTNSGTFMVNYFAMLSCN